MKSDKRINRELKLMMLFLAIIDFAIWITPIWLILKILFTVGFAVLWVVCTCLQFINTPHDSLLNKDFRNEEDKDQINDINDFMPDNPDAYQWGTKKFFTDEYRNFS